MKMTRRDVLKAMPAALATLMLPKMAGALIARAADLPTRKLVVGAGELACVINPYTHELLHAIDVGFPAHSFVQAKTPSHVWAVQRDPRDVTRQLDPMYIALLDIDSGEVVQKIASPSGSQFRGHGFMSPAGDVLYVGLNNVQGGNGYLTAYDTKDYKRLGDLDIGPGGVHECVMGEEGTVFIATSGMKKTLNATGKLVPRRATKTGIIQYDYQRGKIISVMSAEEEHQFIGHLRLLKDGGIVAVSNGDRKPNTLGTIYLGKLGDAALVPARFDARVERGKGQSEMFGLCVNTKNDFIAVTNYYENAVYMLDMKTQMVTAKHDVMTPWGIVFDEKRQVFVTTGKYVSEFNPAMQKLKDTLIRKDAKELTFSIGHSLLV